MNPRGYTYEKRLGVRNVERRPARGTDVIYDWWTSSHGNQVGMVACFPDSWGKDKLAPQQMERIPDEITNIFYIGLDAQPGSVEERLMTVLRLLQMARPGIEESPKAIAFTKLDGALMNVLDATDLLEEIMGEKESSQ